MSHHTAFRRNAAAVGATGLIALSLAGPAAARPDDASGSQPRTGVSAQLSQEQYKCHYLNECKGAPVPTPPNRTTVFLDDNAVEYLQLGAGVLAGIGLAGAGIAVASRRSRAPHLA